MYTQCPDCSSVYEISTQELGAASGLVRCGVCDGTFNALRRLTQEAPKSPEEPPQQPELDFDSPDPTFAPTQQHANDDQSYQDEGSAEKHNAIQQLDSGRQADIQSTQEIDTSFEDVSVTDQEYSSAQDETLADTIADGVFDENLEPLDELSEVDRPSDSPQGDQPNTRTNDEALKATRDELDDTVAGEEHDLSEDEVLYEQSIDELLDTTLNGELATFDELGNTLATDQIDLNQDGQLYNHPIETDLDATKDHELTDNDAVVDELGAVNTAHEETTPTKEAAEIASEDATEQNLEANSKVDAKPSLEDDDEKTSTQEESRRPEASLANDSNSSDAEPKDIDFSSSISLEEWDTLEGEHDLEALLADDALLESFETGDEAVSDQDEHNTQSDSRHDEHFDTADNRDDSNLGEPSTERAGLVEDTADLFDDGLLDENDFIDEEADALSEELEEGQSHQLAENTASELDETDQSVSAKDTIETELEQTDSSANKFTSEKPDENHLETADHEADDVEHNTQDDENEGQAELEDKAQTPTDQTEQEAPQDVLTENVDGQFESDIDDDHDYQDLSQYLKPQKSLLRKVGEGTLAASLLLALAGQYIHYNRSSIATHEHYGPSIQNFYSSIGHEIQIDWDLKDYRIARHTIVPQTNQTEVLLARATVINNTNSERPLPLIKLELKNRWGDAIFARIFEPHEYLQVPPPKSLDAGDRIEIALDLVNPTTENDIGYSFDICLNTAQGPNCGESKVFLKK